MELTKGFVLTCRRVNVLRDFLCQAMDQVEEKDRENAELKQKLEDVQASMYADVVDANMEVRRLKRVLYIVLARSFCCMRELAARNALYDDECKWDNFKTKCRAKAEEYK